MLALALLDCRAARSGTDYSALPPGFAGGGAGVDGASAAPFGGPLSSFGSGGASGVTNGIAGASGAVGGTGALGMGDPAGRGAAGGTAGVGGAGLAGASGAGIGGAGGHAGAGAGGALGVAGNPEMGRLAGITAAHNAVRAMVQTTPALSPLTWSPTLAAYAQQWADMLAKTCNPQHRSQQDLAAKGYGENLAATLSTGGSPMSTAQWAVSGWAGEVACWTYGTIADPLRGGGTEKCDQSCYQSMNSDGCGHYTQIVWRKSTQLGCGVSTCMQGGATQDIWICNYSPAGNVIGFAPY